MGSIRLLLTFLFFLSLELKAGAILREKTRKFLISEDRSMQGLSIHIENEMDDAMSIHFSVFSQGILSFHREGKTEQFSIGKFDAAGGISRLDIQDSGKKFSFFSKIVKREGIKREELFDASHGFLASVYRTDQGKLSAYRFNDQDGNVIAQLFRLNKDWDLDVYRRSHLQTNFLLAWSCFEIRDRWVQAIKKRWLLGSAASAALLIPSLGYLYHRYSADDPIF